MLYVARIRKSKNKRYQSFRESYEDVIFLHDGVEIDYDFFITEFNRFLHEQKEVPIWNASQIYYVVDRAIGKAEAKTRRHFDFSHTDPSDESVESPDAENGSALIRKILRDTELERFENRLKIRLRLLLVTEPEILLNSIAKRKKFIRQLLEASKVLVAQALRLIRRPVN